MYIKVRAATGQKGEEVRILDDNTLLVSVREKRERNEANKKVLELVNKFYDIRNARIVVGHRSENKVIEIPDDKSKS